MSDLPLVDPYSTRRYPRAGSRFPEGSNEAELQNFLRFQQLAYVDGRVTLTSFTGVDIRPLLYMPPNPEDSDHPYGYFQEIHNLQTISLSSHRPAAPARFLGNASADYARSTRTFAGTMIFTKGDRDPFLEAYARCELERPDQVPFFVDQMPPFHIILHATNEMGIQASAALLYIHITDYGDTFTIDDLVPEVTYGYVCKWFHPFLDRDHWRRDIRDAVTWVGEGTSPKVSDLAPPDATKDLISGSPNSRFNPMPRGL